MRIQPVNSTDADDALIYRNGILDYDAHDSFLRSLGYEYMDLPCICGGSEDDGHKPTCGWGRTCDRETTLVTIDGVDMPDFGFRSFAAHLNDYDLFRDYAPCWERDAD